MKKLAIPACAVLLAVAFVAEAQLKAEDQIKLRKSAYALMGYTLGDLEAMAEGKKPFSREEAVREAELMVHLSRVPKGFFGEGTDKGETRALPEIWAKRSDFDAKMDKMVAEVAKLPAASRDAASLKAAVKAADDSCAACHKEYRQRRRG